MQMRGRMLHHGLGRSALQSRACARRPKPVRLRARDVGAPARGCWYTRARTPARSYGQDHTHVKKCFEQGMCTRRVVMGMLTGGAARGAAQATFYALQRTYGFLSPELWKETRYTKSPMQEFTDFLAKPAAGDFKPPGDFPPV